MAKWNIGNGELNPLGLARATRERCKPNPCECCWHAHLWTPLPDGPFDLIEADPNWTYKSWSKKGDAGNTRVPECHYPTATIEQITHLPVASIAHKNCHLALWITGSQVVNETHVTVMDAWG